MNLQERLQERSSPRNARQAEEPVPPPIKAQSPGRADRSLRRRSRRQIELPRGYRKREQPSWRGKIRARRAQRRRLPKGRTFRPAPSDSSDAKADDKNNCICNLCGIGSETSPVFTLDEPRHGRLSPARPPLRGDSGSRAKPPSPQESSPQEPSAQEFSPQGAFPESSRQTCERALIEQSGDRGSEKGTSKKGARCIHAVLYGCVTAAIRSRKGPLQGDSSIG